MKVYELVAEKCRRLKRKCVSAYKNAWKKEKKEVENDDNEQSTPNTSAAPSRPISINVVPAPTVNPINVHTTDDEEEMTPTMETTGGPPPPPPPPAAVVKEKPPPPDMMAQLRDGINLRKTAKTPSWLTMANGTISVDMPCTTGGAPPPPPPGGMPRVTQTGVGPQNIMADIVNDNPLARLKAAPKPEKSAPIAMAIIGQVEKHYANKPGTNSSDADDEKKPTDNDIDRPDSEWE